MNTIRLAIQTKVALLGVLTLSLLTPPSLQGQEELAKEKEQIGEVLGRPVYRHQIHTGKGVTLRDELSRLFLSPVIEKYNKEHKAEITPTEDEIKAVANYFDQQHALRIKDDEAALRQQLKAAQDALKRDGLTKEEKDKLTIEQLSIESRLMPPGRMFAAFILQNWKLQKHLYDKFGGGRILWQQAGQEAFDATHRWLESLEQAGEFKITDPKLRAATYEYWTTMKHGSFLTADKARIQKEFLEPEWLPKPEQIGEVLGVPVFRNQFRTTGGFRLRGELFDLFMKPVMLKYCRDHKQEIAPTDEEQSVFLKKLAASQTERIQDAEPGLLEEIKETEKALANKKLPDWELNMLTSRRLYLFSRRNMFEAPKTRPSLSNWKFEKHLYDKFGGGRILRTNGGEFQVYDAMRKCLESLEQAGDFKIVDPKLRAAFYELWTSEENGLDLLNDAEQIQRKFLNPDWNQEPLVIKKEQIGEVLGKPVYRHQIRPDNVIHLPDELYWLFIYPVDAKYRRKHSREITATEEELAAAMKHRAAVHEVQVQEELKKIDKQIADKNTPYAEKEALTIRKSRLEQRAPLEVGLLLTVLEMWKYERHLYNNFGGGRIRRKDAGLWVFDAHKKWLEAMEESGEFKITDPELRELIYERWNSSKYDAYLTDNSEIVRKELLEPEWIPKQEAK